jgi:hypothetical protein
MMLCGNISLGNWSATNRCFPLVRSRTTWRVTCAPLKNTVTSVIFEVTFNVSEPQTARFTISKQRMRVGFFMDGRFLVAKANIQPLSQTLREDMLSVERKKKKVEVEVEVKVEVKVEVQRAEAFKNEK